MSIFKSKGVILKIAKTSPGEFLYTIFTKEYGKILCNTKLSKKEKTLDSGYLINFEITTKENQSIHKIRNIKILSEFNREGKTFKELNAYLIILSVIHNKIPTGSPIYELFNLLEIINSHPNMSETKLILSRLKIISIFGELNENNTDITVSKILKFININKIDRVLKLSGISEEIKNKLEVL